MQTAWFWFLAAMITVYVVLDGFDLGVGAIYRFVARTDEERSIARRAIGPVWEQRDIDTAIRYITCTRITRQVIQFINI